MYRLWPMPYGAPLDVLAATASTRSIPLSRSNTTGSPVRASTAVMSILRFGQLWLGSGAATVARHRVCLEPSDVGSSSSAAAPILRRMSAAASEMAMIRFVLSTWSETGRSPDDQVGLSRIHPGIEQAGDDPDLPRIADRSATTKDQRAIAHDRALSATSVGPPICHEPP